MNTMEKSYCFSVNIIRERYPPPEGAGGGKTILKSRTYYLEN